VVFPHYRRTNGTTCYVPRTQASAPGHARSWT
jgi:hypothetical protein